MTSALAASPAVRAIGVALIWFVLQGAIVGAIVAALLLGLRRASANLRYFVACAGLATMALSPIITAARVWTPSPAMAEGASRASHNEGVQGSSYGAFATRESGLRARFTPDRVAPVVVLGWTVGVLVLSARLLGGWLQILRIRKSARRTQVFEWSLTAMHLARRLGMNRAVPLFESTLVGLPVVIGWLKPVILVPAGVLAGLAAEEVEAILAHELAHIRRGDYLVNALQRVVEIVLFYHPAVWWVSACVRREREHCCDDLAAPLSSSRLTYVQALMALEERRGRAPALAMAAVGTGLFARIRRIVDPSSTVDYTFPKGAVMTILSSVLALVLSGAISAGHATAASQPQATGEIRGTVVDQQDARIPGATIAVDPIGREGASRTAMSDAKGQFAVTELSAGAYLMTVKLPGFVRYEHRVDVVPTGGLAESIQLKVGRLEEATTMVSARENETPAQPASPSTSSVADLLDSARQAADAGRLAEAEASLHTALAVLHAAEPPRPAEKSGVVRVGGDIKEPRKIRDVPPVYPAVARAAGVQGIVIVEATVDPYGAVADAHVLRGVPELNEAALDAVRQWTYTPTLLGGVPVSVVMTVTIVFSVR